MPKAPPKTTLEKLQEFDPNASPNVGWATYLPGRRQSGDFKLHKHRGHALNAFHQDGYAILYKWEGGRWVEQARKEGKLPDDQHCDFCGGDGSKVTDPTVRYYSWDPPLKREFQRDPRNNKILDPLNLLVLCRNCRD